MAITLGAMLSVVIEAVVKTPIELAFFLFALLVAALGISCWTFAARKIGGSK